jgi:hypothetical protein
MNKFKCQNEQCYTHNTKKDLFNHNNKLLSRD